MQVNIKSLLDARQCAMQADDHMDSIAWRELAMVHAQVAQAEALTALVHFAAQQAASQEEATDALKRIAAGVQSIHGVLINGVPVERVP